MKSPAACLDQLADFDEIIDVRTPLEYADDHIPGAINAPVLSNEQRVVIGTLYRQSPFDATRLGAAMVAQNIARHLETCFADRPRQWRPLIYCWRGGKRSGAMTVWFNMIGWHARQLDGGYKSYRRSVLDTLEHLPQRFTYKVLVGHTGTGKTRLLQALAQAGAQTLDLEHLSRHRGSLLGAWPGHPQPSQKSFDSTLLATLSPLDPTRPVFVEAESARIGRISLPKSLLNAFHAGACIEVAANLDERIAFLLADYSHLFDDPDHFKGLLDRLVGLHSKKTIARWHSLIDSNQRAELFRELIEQHYDPAYTRSCSNHFPGLPDAMRMDFRPTAADSLEQAAQLLRQIEETRPSPGPHAGAMPADPLYPEN